MNTSPQSFQIPKNIQRDIQERGFHLYKWISPDEVKRSIERDFLGVIQKIGIPLAVIAILAALISGTNIAVFFVVIFIGVIGMFLYLLYLSIKRSFLLSKSAFVVLTDSSISLGGKIYNLSDFGEYQKDLEKVGSEFEEQIFEESRLEDTNKSLKESVIKQLFGGYETILAMSNKSSSRSKDSAGGILLLIGLYTLYIAVMAVVYFFGVLGLFIFGKCIMWANTIYLLKKGEKVIQINSLFGKIHRASENIYEKKSELEKLLSDAQNHDWKDGILLQINSGIESINSSAMSATESIVALRSIIKKSKYTTMFRFEVYENWIKEQITHPLGEILRLLEVNKETLMSAKQDLESQIQSLENDSQFIPNLKLALTRVEMQIGEIDTFIPELKTTLKKLQ